MKLERDRTIPAFRDKSWRERAALRREACRRDRYIGGLSMLSVFLAWWVFPLSNWLLKRFGSDSSLLLFLAVSIAMMISFLWLFHALLIAPRVQRALESHES